MVQQEDTTDIYCCFRGVKNGSALKFGPNMVRKTIFFFYHTSDACSQYKKQTILERVVLVNAAQKILPQQVK